MDKIICVQCGAENEPDYKFCKYCGAVLPTVERKNAGEPDHVPQAPFFRQDAEREQTAENGGFDGVSPDELAAYIGRKADRLMPKMYALQTEGKKVVWSWPAAVLGFFFGFFGIAFWCFYRKMKKLGAIALACGVLLFAADAAVNFNCTADFMTDYFKAFGNYMQSDLDTAAMTEFINDIGRAQEALAVASVGVFGDLNTLLGNLVCPLLMGLFSMYLYKKKALADIKRFKATAVRDTHYMMRLSLLGGTSGGLVVIPVAVMVLAEMVFAMAMWSVVFAV